MAEEKLKGYSGWLIFLSLSLIINIVLVLWSIFNILAVLSKGLFLNLFIEIAIIICFSLSLYYLSKEDKKGIEILKWALWLPVIDSLLLYFIFISEGIPYEEITTNIARGIVYALIWTSYLRKSERVKNTYYKKK